MAFVVPNAYVGNTWNLELVHSLEHVHHEAVAHDFEDVHHEDGLELVDDVLNYCWQQSVLNAGLETGRP